MAIQYYISSNKYSLHERQTKLNGKVYDLVFRIVTLDGVEKQKWLRGFKTKTLAKEAYLAFVTEKCELVKNNPIKKKKDPSKEVLLVGDLVRQYMATLGNQNKASVIYDKNNIFRIFILSKYDKTPLDKLTKEELYLWQDELWQTKNPKTGEYFSWKYLIKIRGYFSTFLTWCEQRYGYRNNFADVTKPKRRLPKKEMQFWTRDQFDKFISNVTDPTYHALFIFMFYTGRRKGELFALSPSDVTATTIKINKSLTRKTLNDDTYGITSTKADKSQILPVCEVVQREIANYKAKGKFYFGGDTPLGDNTVRRKFLEYTEIAGLPQIRIHDLRHSFVSMLIHLGGNFMVVADLIGDTVEQVTKTYGHMYQEDKLSIIARIK
jgi:integrase